MSDTRTMDASMRVEIGRRPARFPLPMRAMHWTMALLFLYLAMPIVPIVGYIASSAVPPIESIWFFGLELPLFPVEKNYDATVFFIAIRKYVGYAMILVIALHVAGALKHRFFDKPEHDVLSKMLR